MRLRSRAAVLILALTLGACGQSAGTTHPQSPSPETVPGAGTIVGTYGERPHDSSAPPRPVGGVTIGVFLQAFQPGTLQYSPPQPVVQAVTATDGSFRITGLHPGRYFVVPIDAKAVATGQWVEVGSTTGARVDLIGCTDCPPPA